MINQYQPLDSGIHYFQTNPNQKAIRFFPRPPPADRTNRPISSLKCYRLTIWFWKKEFPNKSPLGLLEQTPHSVIQQFWGETSTSSLRWLKIQPLTSRIGSPHRAVSDFTTNFGRWTCKISRYATVCRNLEWTCSKNCTCWSIYLVSQSECAITL